MVVLLRLGGGGGGWRVIAGGIGEAGKKVNQSMLIEMRDRIGMFSDP